MAASASKLGIHVDWRWLWKLFVKRHRQLATNFNHRKSHWNTRRPPTDCLIADSRSVAYKAYIAHATGVWCSDVGICDARVCTVFVSSRSGIVFNQSADSITDHRQSGNDIDPYFKSQLYEKGSGTESRYSVYRMGWVNLESERTTEILHSAVGGIRTRKLLIDSPACYHWAITTPSGHVSDRDAVRIHKPRFW